MAALLYNAHLSLAGRRVVVYRHQRKNSCKKQLKLVSGFMIPCQNYCCDRNMAAAASKVIFLDEESLPELRDRLSKRKSPNVIIIDSVICLVGMRLADYQKLMNDYPNKLFIFLAHEDDRGNPSPALAEKIRKLSDIKMHVEGYKVFTTTRYEDRTKGEGGEDFTIWEEGAAEYRAEL